MIVAMMWTGFVILGLSSAAQKNYVLDAPLGDKPIAGVDVDIMNI